jgi:hypothetical protein
MLATNRPDAITAARKFVKILTPETRHLTPSLPIRASVLQDQRKPY